MNWKAFGVTLLILSIVTAYIVGLILIGEWMPWLLYPYVALVIATMAGYIWDNL